MSKRLSERQIVDYIIDNWDRLMDSDIKFYNKEYYWLPDWRCDISAYVLMDLKEQGYTDQSYMYRAPIFIEAKYKSDARDLIFELEKALYARDKGNWPRYVGVMMDDYSNQTILDYLIEHNIFMWKINIKDDDLETLTIEFYEPDKMVLDR